MQPKEIGDKAVAVVYIVAATTPHKDKEKLCTETECGVDGSQVAARSLTQQHGAEPKVQKSGIDSGFILCACTDRAAHDDDDGEDFAALF